MSLLQRIIGQLSGSQPADPQQQTNLLESITGLLNNPQIGGIGGLAQMFKSKGLGDIINGWISTGPNPPITRGQIHQALGPDHVDRIAKKMGVGPDEAADRLAAVLPDAVDHLTPDGQLPADGMNMQAMLSALKSKFLYS